MSQRFKKKIDNDTKKKIIINLNQKKNNKKKTMKKIKIGKNIVINITT